MSKEIHGPLSFISRELERNQVCHAFQGPSMVKYRRVKDSSYLPFRSSGWIFVDECLDVLVWELYDVVAFEPTKSRVDTILLAHGDAAWGTEFCTCRVRPEGVVDLRVPFDIDSDNPVRSIQRVMTTLRDRIVLTEEIVGATVSGKSRKEIFAMRMLMALEEPPIPL